MAAARGKAPLEGEVPAEAAPMRAWFRATHVAKDSKDLDLAAAYARFTLLLPTPGSGRGWDEDELAARALSACDALQDLQPGGPCVCWPLAGQLGRLLLVAAKVRVGAQRRVRCRRAGRPPKDDALLAAAVRGRLTHFPCTRRSSPLVRGWAWRSGMSSPRSTCGPCRQTTWHARLAPP